MRGHDPFWRVSMSSAVRIETGPLAVSLDCLLDGAIRVRIAIVLKHSHTCETGLIILGYTAAS